MPTITTIRYIHRMFVIIPVYLFLICACLIMFTDIEEIKNHTLKEIVIYCILMYAAIHLIRGLILIFGRWIVSSTTKSFTPQKHLNRFEECKQITNCSGEKREHIVLLFHGFTTSPMEWDFLGKHLKQQGIDFHAPLIYGFGQINMHMILSVSKEDWFRQIINLYDLFEPRYKKISVVGHSMGGLLACILAQHRNVHELIISAPSIFPQKSQKIYTYIIKHRITVNLFAWLIPIIPKPMRGKRKGPADTMDSESTYNHFQYLVAPVRLLIAMLRAQTEVKFNNIRCSRLSLFYGEYDITINNKEIESFMEECNIPFERYKFKKSAHNIFVDYDRIDINKLVVDLLNNTIEPNIENNSYEYKKYELTEASSAKREVGSS